MASEPDKRKSPAGRSGSKRRRPVTLDLEAEGAKTSAAEPAPERQPAKAAAPSASATAAMSAESAPETAPEPPPPSAAPTALTSEAADPAGADWTAMALPAVLGAVAAILLLYLLAAVGLAPFLSDGSGRTALATTEELRTEIANLKAAAPSTDVDTRIAGLTERIGRLEDNVAGLGTRIDKLAADVAAEADAAPPNLAAVEGRIAILAERLNTLTATTDASGLEARVAALEAAAAKQPDMATVAPTVLVATLRVAAENGDPYRAELDALSGLTIAPDALAILQSHADTGVPSRAALIAGYPEVAAAMRDALQDEEDAEPEGNWFSRIFGRVESLVEVRPIESVAGDSPEAVLSRVGASVERGDLAAALGERQNLPAEAQAASSDWADQVAERIALDQAVASLAGAARSPAPAEPGKTTSE